MGLLPPNEALSGKADVVITTLSTVGTNPDRQIHRATDFAADFYENLLGGLTVGESVLKARQKDADAQYLTWTQYVLNGDPTLRVRDPRVRGGEARS